MKIFVIGPKYLYAEVRIIEEATSENISLLWFNTSNNEGKRLIWLLLPFIFDRSFHKAFYIAYLDETCGITFQSKIIQLKRTLGAIWRILSSIRFPKHIVTNEMDAIIVPEVIYRWRLLVYYLKRKFDIPVLAMQMGSLHHVYDYNRTSFLSPQSMELKPKLTSETRDFLSLRKEGMVKNIEGSKMVKSHVEKIFDIGIWLPISLDTPFQKINEKRIFKNYYEWIKFTLDFLAGKNLKCLIKFHPSSVLWNDSLQPWILDNYQKVENFKFDLNNQHSSIACDRIVSFKGTVAIEELLRGRNSCIINSIPGFDKFLVIPQSFQEYKDYLLNKNSLQNYNHNEIEYNLLIREYYMTYIYRLRNKVQFVYRGDSEDFVLKRMNKLIPLVKKDLSRALDGCFNRAINDKTMLQ